MLSGKQLRRSFAEEFKWDSVKLVAVIGYSFNRVSQSIGESGSSLLQACDEDTTFQQIQEEVGCESGSAKLKWKEKN